MRKNNKGLSLVELIVVIALMAVLIGIGGFSFSLLFGTQAKACAQNVSAKLNETKTGCMSRYNEEMTLSYRYATDTDEAIKSDGYYAENWMWTMNKAGNEVKASDSEIRKMGSSRVVIEVYMTGLSGPFNLNEGSGNSVTVSFDRASGAFEEAKATVNGVDCTGYIEKITFQSGLRTYTITMVPKTGKHTLQG